VVGVAGDGQEGLTAAGELAPDVVLLDVNLPDASGFEVAVRLAREQPGAAVLLTSTQGHHDFDQLALACGAPRVCDQGRSIRGGARSAARLTLLEGQR
jgi:DNA-binding NarL/FixJ family response regulator